MEEQLLYLNECDQQRVKVAIAKHLESAEHHLRKPLGTFQLVWPHNLPMEVHFFDMDKFRNSKTTTTTEDHLKRAKKYPQLVEYFGFEYNGHFCKSVPYLLGLTSCEKPRHRLLNQSNPNDHTLAEYPFPPRFKMEGDFEESLNPQIDEDCDHCCVFCRGHHPSDNCKEYSSPAMRHIRLRNINYTMMVLGALQICPACLTREINHPEHEECILRRSCENCTTGGHNTALCTTATHVIAKFAASKKKRNRSLTLKMIENIVRGDKQVREAEYSRIEKVRGAIVRMATKDCLARIKAVPTDSQQHFEDLNNNNVLTKEETAKKPEQATRALNHTAVHANCAALVAIQQVVPTLMNFSFKSAGDLPQFVYSVAGLLHDNESQLKCGRATCKSGKIAAYFCECGLFRLCGCCLFGNDDFTYTYQKNELKCCPICYSAVSVPNVPGRHSYETYHEKLIVVQTLLLKTIKALLNWVDNSIISLDHAEYEATVENPITILRNQLRCPTCKKIMDCESRLIMKSHCDCGILECRECVLSKGVSYHKECGNYIRSYGTCIGLSVISIVCRHLVVGQTSSTTGLLRQIFTLAMSLQSNDGPINLQLSRADATQSLSATAHDGNRSVVDTSTTVEALNPWQRTLLSIYEIVLKTRLNEVNAQPGAQDLEIAARGVHNYALEHGFAQTNVAEGSSSEYLLATTPSYAEKQIAAQTTQSFDANTSSEGLPASTPPYAAQQLADTRLKLETKISTSSVDEKKLEEDHFNRGNKGY